MGDNLAPYSFFNAVAYVPPQVMFASTGAKDSLANIRESGVFSVSVVGAPQLRAMSDTSATLPRGTDEFVQAGVAKAECTTIPCPRVANAPATLECRMMEVVTLRGAANFLILGEVTGVHIADACLRDGRFAPDLWQPVARMGYRDYATLAPVFEMRRPGEE